MSNNNNTLGGGAADAAATSGSSSDVSPPTVGFSGRIADMQTSIAASGLRYDLWVPDSGVCSDEEKAFEEPHEPQLLAALGVFVRMFGMVKNVWVHLAAEMQAGKTGVIATVARLVLTNARALGFASDRIFVTTGMSDDAWQKQTNPRLARVLRDNVHHGGTLSQVAAKLTRLAKGGTLKNIVIFVDESHYATGSTNQPAKYLYEAVARLCPREMWAENNIRFVTISATDPAKVLAQKASEVPCNIVRLHTTSLYQSVEKLQSLDRIRFLEQIPENGVLHSKTGFAAMERAVRESEAVHGPLVHILRPNHGKGGAVAADISRAFPRAVVHQWDVASNKEKRKTAKDDSSSGVGSATDINVAILNDKPEITTFVLLKGMFRAAKTLNDEHVGVLYDRVGSGDATNLQSLLGRACGYGKSTRTVIFASRSTVDNYLRLWRELCFSKDFPTEGEDDVFSKMKGRMPGVTTTPSGDSTTKLVATKSHATPLGKGLGTATAEEEAAAAKQHHDDDEYDVEWSAEFKTVEELKASKVTSGRMPTPGKDGFFKNANDPKKGPMSRAHLMALKAGKKTTNMREELEPGEVGKRTYPFYEDPSDPRTVRFVVKTLTRKPRRDGGGGQ
jgi:hypothetical protein